MPAVKIKLQWPRLCVARLFFAWQSSLSKDEEFNNVIFKIIHSLVYCNCFLPPVLCCHMRVCMSVINGVGSNLILTYSQFNRTLSPHPFPPCYPCIEMLLFHIARDECGSPNQQFSAKYFKCCGEPCADGGCHIVITFHFHFPSSAAIMTPTHTWLLMSLIKAGLG